MSFEDLFLAHLPHIDKVVAHLCRKHHFRKEECEDFQGEVRVKIIDGDYAVFRKFQGRSSLKTYLTTVIQNLMLDYQNHLWGKWRPSAEAQRLGKVAIHLEKLLRDGLSFDEAVQVLQTNHKVEMPWQDLAKMAARLPDRFPRRMEGEDGIRDLPAPKDRADSQSNEEEREAILRKILAALEEVRKALPKEDQVILKMQGDGFTVVQISRFLGHDEQQKKQLYRRIQKILKELREELERRGFSKGDIDGLFDD